MAKQELKMIGAVAAEVGIDRWRLAYLIERGTVPDASVKVPGRRLFTAEDVEAIKTALAEYRSSPGRTRGGSGTAGNETSVRGLVAATTTAAEPPIPKM